MKKAETLFINCPWCGAVQEHELRGSDFEVICNGGLSASSGSKKWCSRPIRMEVDRKTGAVKIGRARSIRGPPYAAGIKYPEIPPQRSYAGSPTTMETYEESIKLINSARHVSDDLKAQAKNILKYVHENAPYFLPVVAEGVKKVFYI